ncbi:hypothetical protein M426DRAFT_257630 [Hypoxylon sp. CI-4A]|nr:hypothetical protein M426DRAFT_257630 [Hypoxylon sp. CI-4A]
MSSIVETRSTLTEEEHARRALVYDLYNSRYLKTSRKCYEVMHKRFEKHMVEQLYLKNIQHTLSASYFEWNLDRRLWDIFYTLQKPPPEFPYPAPEMYGGPYSEAYLSYYQQPYDEVLIGIMLREFDEQMDSAPSRLGRCETPSVNRNHAFLKGLWDWAMGKQDYERGCDEPFTIRIPCGPGLIDFDQGFGSDDHQIIDNLREASLLLSDVAVELIVSSNDKGQVFLHLDFSEKADKKDPQTSIDFFRAWRDLAFVKKTWLEQPSRDIVTVIALMYARTTDELKDRVVPAPASGGSVEELIQKLRKNYEARIRENTEVLPNDPKRDARLQHRQFHHIKNAATKIANRVLISCGSFEQIKRSFDLFGLMVREQEFGLTKKQIMDIGAHKAILAATYHVRGWLLSVKTIHRAKNALCDKGSEFGVFFKYFYVNH